MEGICNARLVRANAADLDGVGCIRRATVDERGPDERNNVMSSGEDEVTDETFIAVNDEVSAKFFWFLMALDEICRRHAAEITPYGLQ